MSVFDNTLGVVAEGDTISLSADIRITPTQLIDRANGAVHTMRPRAFESISHMAQGILVNDWMARVGITKKEAYELLRFLDSIAALVINRSLASALLHAMHQCMWRMKGVRMQVAAKRYPGSFTGVVKGVMRASMSIALLIAMVVMLGYASGLGTHNFVVAHMWLLFCLLTTTILHEYVHLSFALQNRASATVVVRGLRIGVLHSPLSQKYELSSAIAGPMAGIVVAFLMFVATLMLYNSIFITVSVAVVAIFHACSWLPEYGDGVAIKTYMRRWYAKAS